MRKKASKSLYLWFSWLFFLFAYINVAALLIFSETAVGYTGHLVLLPMNILQRELEAAFFILPIILIFTLGSVVSGFFFPKEQFHMRDLKYGRVLLAMGASLVCLAFLPLNLASFYALVFFMGFQNAMTMAYQGLALPTTALTGVLSILGLALGRQIMHRGDEWGDLTPTLLGLLACLLGGSLPLVLFQGEGANLLVWGGAFYLLGGLYFYWKRDQIYYLEV